LDFVIRSFAMEIDSKVYDLLDGGRVRYFPGFLAKEQADELWELCKYLPGEQRRIPWLQAEIVVGTRTILEPRHTAFLGEKDGLQYTYSAKRNISKSWPPLVKRIKDSISQIVGHDFNVALMNWYAYGGQGVSWHSDSETDLVPGATIASLSLGTTRKFQLRHKSDSEIGAEITILNNKKNQGEDLTKEELELLKYKVGEDPNLNMELNLQHGDLLLMQGTLQKFWRHRVPLTKDVLGPRICFTFRLVAEGIIKPQ